MGSARRRRGSAGDDVQIVEVRGKRPGDGNRVVLHHAVLVMLVAGHAHADDELTRNLGADRPDGVAGEAHAVVEGAAILIFTVVDARVHELGRQVAVAGHDLDPVGTGLRHAAGGLGKTIDDIADH